MFAQVGAVEPAGHAGLLIIVRPRTQDGDAPICAQICETAVAANSDLLSFATAAVQLVNALQ